MYIASGTWLDDRDVAFIVGQNACDGYFRLEDAVLGFSGADAEILHQAGIYPDVCSGLLARALGHQLHIHEGRLARLVEVLPRHHRVVPVKDLLAFGRTAARVACTTLAFAELRETIAGGKTDERDRACHHPGFLARRQPVPRGSHCGSHRPYSP